MALRRAWVLPLTPIAVVLLIAVALVPVTAEHPAWPLAVLAAALVLAAVISAAAGRVSGEPAERLRAMAIGTGLLTAITPFAITPPARRHRIRLHLRFHRRDAAARSGVRAAR